jgi:hypothetical protein
MRALPMVDGRLAGETLPAFGLRVLTFVMVSGVTATVSDDGLHAADHRRSSMRCPRRGTRFSRRCGRGRSRDRWSHG